MRIPVSGMNCQACATTIEDTISQLPGAHNVHANFALKQLNFEGLDLDTVIKKLRELGYDSPQSQKSSVFHVEEIESLGLKEKIIARRRFLLALVLGFPEMGRWWFHTLPHWTSYMDALLASVVVFVAGFEIHSRTFKQLKNGHVNMDTLVSLGSGAALLQSFVLLFRGSTMPGFEVSSTIIVFILFGRYLEAATRRETYSSTAELFSAFQHPVLRFKGKNQDQEETVLGLDLKVGDRIRLRPGEISPVDGVIVEGKTQMTDQALTGEVTPKSVGPGSRILSGSTIIDSPVTVVVKLVGQDSFLGRLIIELEKAQSQTIPIQRLADRVTTYFVPGVIAFACLSSLAQFFLKSATPEFSFNVFLSVLLMACPCALGLAIPTALVAGLGASAKRGILFRDAAVLEACSGIKEIYLDKTGTLTLGQPRLEKIMTFGSVNERDLLLYAAALNRQTIHPLAKALADAAIGEKLFALPTPQNIKVRPGEGVEGEVQGHRIVLVRSKQKNDDTDGDTSSDLFIDDKLEGQFLFKDKLIPEAPEVLKILKSWGLTLHILTGDSFASVRQLGLDKMVESVRAGLLPQDKEFIVRAAREKDPRGVAFVGDGINDVLALSAATVGIAVATGSPAALGAGSLSISNGIKDLPNVFYFAARVARQLKFNLIWAFAYNIVMLPWAASGEISPMWASLAMAMSSVSVVLGSVWLGFRLRHQ